MAVEAEKLAEKLRELVKCRADDKSPLRIDDCVCVALGLLADAVELLATEWDGDWDHRLIALLRRVAEATEGGEDGPIS